MDKFEVVVWHDTLADGTICYAAWCTSVLGVSGQGDTEEEALADILSAMAANVFEPWPDDWPVEPDARTAAAELETLIAELEEAGTWYRRRRVTRDALRKAHASSQTKTRIAR